MMRSVLTSAASLCLAIALVTSSSHAKEYVGEIGGFGGVLIPDDELSGVPDQELGDSSPLAGGRIGFLFNDQVGWFADVFHAWVGTVRPQGDTGTWDLRTGFDFYGPELWDRAPLFLALGGGVERLEFDAGNKTIHRPLASLGLGQRIGLGSNFALRWEVRGDYAFEDTEDFVEKELLHFGAHAGISWLFGAYSPDTDADGVKDRKDRCPNTPRGAIVDMKGCPVDTDGDAVPDGLDKCPTTPRGWPVDASGCPTDADGDGVPDGRDRCADTPTGAVVDADGCPLDGDGDGVPDGIDKCPDTKAGVRVDARGCARDTDQDGVPDGVDECPDTPLGTKVDPTGCPEVAKLFEEEKTELILEGVEFETNRAELRPVSQAVLNRVAESLRAWPEIRVEIGGHTDSRGSDSHNLELSRQRAESVREYLVAAGVSASQLTTKGYGETKPAAENATAEGRERNRRVELKKID
jgi:outer membrane protein OmpA-like peptidoglycan-associated protein